MDSFWPIRSRLLVSCKSLELFSYFSLPEHLDQPGMSYDQEEHLQRRDGNSSNGYFRLGFRNVMRHIRGAQTMTPYSPGESLMLVMQGINIWLCMCLHNNTLRTWLSVTAGVRTQSYEPQRPMSRTMKKPSALGASPRTSKMQ